MEKHELNKLRKSFAKQLRLSTFNNRLPPSKKIKLIKKGKDGSSTVQVS